MLPVQISFFFWWNKLCSCLLLTLDIHQMVMFPPVSSFTRKVFFCKFFFLQVKYDLLESSSFYLFLHRLEPAFLLPKITEHGLESSYCWFICLSSSKLSFDKSLTVASCYNFLYSGNYFYLFTAVSVKVEAAV